MTDTPITKHLSFFAKIKQITKPAKNFFKNFSKKLKLNFLFYIFLLKLLRKNNKENKISNLKKFF